jgi:sigma-B regulation protein RsbU (phosphoserine phosphatase)
MQIEMATAREVQQGFFPQPAPASGTLDYSARCRQADAVGGDAYDFIPLEDGRIAIMIGDASGKGLAAALMIASVHASVRTAATHMPDDPARVLAAVNRQTYATSLVDRYATLFYGVFDPDTLTLSYVNAGHNPPALLRRDGSVEWLEAGGAPAGMFADWSYQTAVVQLRPGDRLIAYTDGVTEAVNPAAEFWGTDVMLRAASNGSAEEIVDAIFASMDAFAGSAPQRDDATVAVLRVR